MANIERSKVQLIWMHCLVFFFLSAPKFSLIELDKWYIEENQYKDYEETHRQSRGGNLSSEMLKERVEGGDALSVKSLRLTNLKGMLMLFVL